MSIIRFFRIDTAFSDIELPSYQTTGSAGMDIRAAVSTPLTVAAKGFVKVPTNLNVEIPEGYEIQVRPRSSLAAKHGVTILNAPGTIDSDYRGEIGILLINHGEKPYTIERGERVAQLVVAKVEQIKVEESKEPLSQTERGEGGFGSTGKH